MNTNQLFRQSGAALIGAGVLIALGMGLHPNIGDPQAATQALWAPTHLALLAGLILLAFGLTGLFLRHAERAGRIGLAGYALLEVGIMLTTVAIVADAFIFPTLEQQVAALLDPAGPLLGGPLGLLLLGATVTYILGTLVLGAAMLRGGGVGRPAVALFMVGGALLAADPFVPQIVARIAAVLLGIGLIWLGATLLGQQAATVRDQAAMAR